MEEQKTEPGSAEAECVELCVPPDANPERIDVYLAARLDTLSRSRIQHLIASGHVRVDGQVVKPRHALEGGETITVRMPEPTAPEPKPEAIPLSILYEDADLLVIDKPAGMVVHPGAGVASGTLVNAVLHHCPDLSGIGGAARPGIVHRLDRLTSGCLVIAKNDAAHQALSDQLAHRTMGRTYLAWVCGEMEEAEGRIDAPIGRSKRNRTRMAVTGRHGRPAATNWRVVARASGLTRIECRLESGRTHQIRVHMHLIGHPVAGDPEYGLSARDARQCVAPGHPHIIQALSRLKRQMLHAYRIAFTHPTTNERMEFEAPPPEDFAAFDEAVLRGGASQ